MDVTPPQRCQDNGVVLDRKSHSSRQVVELHNCDYVCVCRYVYFVYLQDSHLVAQLTLLFSGEAKFVNDLDGNIPARLPVFALGKMFVCHYPIKSVRKTKVEFVTTHTRHTKFNIPVTPE